MEERNLNYFFKNCIERKLCKEYVLLWRNCKTKKDFVDLSLRMSSIPFIADSIYNGWGLSVEFIKDYFADFINGKYIGYDVDCIKKVDKENKLKKYFNTLIYCNYKDKIIFNENIIHVINSDCDLHISFNNEIKIVFISNKSNVKLHLTECATTTIYLFDESKVTVVEDTEHTLTSFYKYSDRCSIVQIETKGKYLFYNKDLKI